MRHVKHLDMRHW